MSSKSLIAPLTIWFAVAAVQAQAAPTQSWDYQSYNSGRPTASGYVTLEEKDGDYSFTFFVPRMDKCYSREMKAVVEQTESTILITLPPLMIGCEEIRFAIKADGSGGNREVKRGEEWVKDRRDYGLTLRK